MLQTSGAQSDSDCALQMLDIHFAQVEHTFTVSQLTAAQLEEKALSQNPCVLLIFHPQDSHTRQLGGHVSTGFSSLPV